MPNTNFPLFYDEIYSSGLDPSARFPVNRYSILSNKLKLLDDGGLIEWRRPRLAEKEEILRVHDVSYVERFLKHELRENEIRRIGLRPWKDSIVERTLRLTGGALGALEEVLEGKAMAGNMAGGTHHAFRAEGAGYCIFNDLAICAEKALERKEINRIVILDLDVHQGDGTAEIFKNNDRVYTISLHGKNNFPFRKKMSDYDYGFPDGTKDREYLDKLDRVLGELKLVEFDLLFYQAGVDGLAEDSLGLLSLSREGLKKRNEKVFEWSRKKNLPTLIFMGGGYSMPIEHSVDAFCDLFMAAALRMK